MSNRFRFEAETRLIRWGESSSAGRTITLELPPDAGEGHPFKGFATGHSHGQRFRMQFDAIADDETNSPAGTSPSTAEKGAVSDPDNRSGPHPSRPPPAGEHKDRRPWETLSPQQQAGILCADKGFQKWVSKQAGWECDEEDAASWLRIALGIESRRELANKPELVREFSRIHERFLFESGRVPEALR